jgi:hypothetical protein
MRLVGSICRRVAPSLLVPALLIGGCSGINTGNNSGGASGHADTAACDLRQGLDCRLEEHVALAAATTDAILAGRNDEFTAAYNALEANSQDIAGAIGAIYGTDTQNSFATLWQKHVTYLVDYTQGLLAKDDLKQKQAVDNLISFTKDAGAFFEQITDGRLNKAGMTQLMVTHVTGLKAIVDAQAANNFAQAFTQQREAAQYMDNIGNTLSDAIVQQFPDKY